MTAKAANLDTGAKAPKTPAKIMGLLVSKYIQGGLPRDCQRCRIAVNPHLAALLHSQASLAGLPIGEYLWRLILEGTDSIEAARTTKALRQLVIFTAGLELRIEIFLERDDHRSAIPGPTSNAVRLERRLLAEDLLLVAAELRRSMAAALEEAKGGMPS